jgi:hypothetical protein
MGMAVDGLKLTGPAAVPPAKQQQPAAPQAPAMARDSYRDVDNNNVQLPIAGANSLPQELPAFLRLDRMLLAIQSRFPKGFGIADKLTRYGGVAAAGVSFLWSGWNLVRTWNRQSLPAKIMNTTSTVATGAGTVAGLAWLRTGSQLASNMMGGFLGVAGTIYQGIKTWNEFYDPTKTAGQRGMSLASTVLTGAGTVAMFIPGGQIVGLPLILAGGALGAVGDWLGKVPVVNKACEWVGHTASKLWHGLFG